MDGEREREEEAGTQEYAYTHACNYLNVEREGKAQSVLRDTPEYECTHTHTRVQLFQRDGEREREEEAGTQEYAYTHTCIFISNGPRKREGGAKRVCS